jgi:hypothetical protein
MLALWQIEVLSFRAVCFSHLQSASFEPEWCQVSRSGYGSDGDYSLWHQAVKRSIEGKRGQSFLMELVASLDAMPEKKLAANSFTKGGEVCALGSVALRRGIDAAPLEPEIYGDGDSYVDREKVAATFGIAPAMAAEIMFENDEAAHWHETPEGRWQRMRDWASSRILNSQASDAGESK